MSNPYVNYALQKGYSLQEVNQTKAPKRTFPCTIGLRTFNSEKEYQDALHDFLNGY